MGGFTIGRRARRLILAKVWKNNCIDLDLPSLLILEEALAAFDSSAIIVFHDRDFLDRICDQIVAFEDNGIAIFF